MIDAHVHLGRLVVEDSGLKPARLLRWMDRHGIEKAIVMAVEVPEEVDFLVSTEALLRLTKRHRDRLFPLCATDPRHEFEPYPILADYMDRGCVGYGENLCGLPVDHPMQQKVYEACNKLGLALVMHFDHWINRDRRGLAGFEKMLARYPNVRFVGHAQNFWREISRKVSSRVVYPRGPVVPGGRLEELFGKYSNLYADLSAQSGYNAITRDPEFGLAFLKRWKHRLMLGTDSLHTRAIPFCSIVGKSPILRFLETAGLPARTFAQIPQHNAERVFKLS